ncbi:unnamed protein product [Linum trigynum]|uniref:Uncharacterized protein n=1 Tax=Linum trigynum TaxID=586398 RepID=A0AAV2FAS2_9ROSI
MPIVDGEPSPDVVEGIRLAMEALFGESFVSGGEEEDTAMQSDGGSDVVGEPTVDEGGACDNSDEGDDFHVHVECVDWIGTVTGSISTCITWVHDGGVVSYQLLW